MKRWVKQLFAYVAHQDVTPLRVPHICVEAAELEQFRHEWHRLVTQPGRVEPPTRVGVACGNYAQILALDT